MEEINKMNKYTLPATILAGAALLGGCSSTQNNLDLAMKRTGVIHSYGPMYTTGANTNVVEPKEEVKENLTVDTINTHLDYLVQMGEDSSSMFYNQLNAPLVATHVSEACQGGLESELCKNEKRLVVAKQMAPLFSSNKPSTQRYLQHAIADYKKNQHGSMQAGYIQENMVKQITFNGLVLTLATLASGSAANAALGEEKAACTAFSAGSGTAGNAIGGASTGGASGVVNTLSTLYNNGC